MRKVIVWLGCIVLLWMICGTGAEATAETTKPDIEENFLEQLQLDEMDEALDEILEDSELSFQETVQQLMKGEMPFTKESMGQVLKAALFAELGNQKARAVQILVILIASAVFASLSNVFEKSPVADVSFYMVYMLMFTALMKAFAGMSELTSAAIEKILQFMKILMPSYAIAGVFASGSISGIAFYELTLGLITAVNTFVCYILVPAVNLYVVFELLDNMSKEEYLSKMAELIQTFVEWSLKTMLAVVIGVQTIQGLILPAIDSLKTSVANKAAGAIPGVGNLLSGVSEVVLGSAVLIKNAIGVAGLIVVAVICAMPLLKLGVCTLMYKVMAAVTQPMTDKRMSACVAGVGNGAALLFRILMNTGVLFFLSIAMATASIGG